MEYYILTNSTETKEIGRKYPQCKGVPYGYTFKWFEAENSMTKLSNLTFPDFIPDLQFELEEKAKLSDMVSPSNISAKGILCSPKMLDLIASYIMDSHKVFNAKILFNDVWYDYHWIHFVYKDIDFIDLENSVFYKSRFGTDKGDVVYFKSYKEGVDIMINNNYCDILPSKLIIKDSFKNNIKDIFFLRLTNRIIVSDRIADIIRKNKLTGIKLVYIG